MQGGVIGVDVRMDVRGTRRYLSEVERRVVPQVTVRALNRVGTTVKAEAARAIREEAPALKIGRIKQRITIRRANPIGPEVVITARGAGMPLIEYRARQVRGGVAVTIKRGRTVVRHAFMATMKSGHQGVFMRRLQGEARARRLPVDELFSSTVADLFSNPKAISRMLRVAGQRWPIEFERELAHALRSAA